MQTQIEALIILAGVQAIVGAVFAWCPIANAGTFFGVRTEPEYRDSLEARQTLARFRRSVGVSVLATILLSSILTLLGRFGLGAVIGAPILALSSSLAFRAGWKRTRPQSIAPSPVRVANLRPEPVRFPGGFLAWMGPYLVVAGVSLWVLAHWDAIPQRFPTHWDLDDHANGWSGKSVPGVFGGTFFGFGVLTLLLVIAATQRLARGASATNPRTRATMLNMVIMMWVIAAGVANVALLPLSSQPPNSLLVVGLPLAGVALCLWIGYRAIAAPDDSPTPDVAPDDCWKWGQLYYNPDDPSVIVEKRCGLGSTLNFARPLSWLVIAGIVALTALPMILRKL